MPLITEIAEESVPGVMNISHGKEIDSESKMKPDNLHKKHRYEHFLINAKQFSPASTTNTLLLHWAPPRLRLSYGQASVGPAGRQVGGAIIHRWSWGVLVSQYIKKRPEG